mgnify:FL=1
MGELFKAMAIITPSLLCFSFLIATIELHIEEKKIEKIKKEIGRVSLPKYIADRINWRYEARIMEGKDIRRRLDERERYKEELDKLTRKREGQKGLVKSDKKLRQNDKDNRGKSKAAVRGSNPPNKEKHNNH